MEGSRARALLGVPEHATTQQISRAFRGAAFVAHPDRGGSERGFRELVAARDVLLASAPRLVVANPFSSTIKAPATPVFSTVDIERAAPATHHPAAFPVRDSTVERRFSPREPDFEAVLAAVLAAA